MFKLFKSIYKPYMTRPLIYQTFTRAVYALLISLLWDKFVNDGMLNKSFVFLFVGAVFAILSWISYLHLDGVRMPNLSDWLTSTLPQKKPERSYGDMSDYIDEEVVNYSELESDEKCLCRMLANAVCAIIYILLSLIVW